MECYTYKMAISYDGTNYSGWQKQPHRPTIQGTIEHALHLLTKSPLSVIGAGRTDAEVHALEQIAHFRLSSPISLSKIHKALNALLPQDIRILRLEEVSNDFHARYQAKKKTYRYSLQLGKVPNPFLRLYSYHLPYSIDLSLLEQGKNAFVGTHNFLSFANQGSKLDNPIRTIHAIRLIPQGEILFLEFIGNGFLYKMIRNIVGTLLEVARGKLPLTAIPELLEKRDRKCTPKAAPAHGLSLITICYSEEMQTP